MPSKVSVSIPDAISGVLGIAGGFFGVFLAGFTILFICLFLLSDIVNLKRSLASVLMPGEDDRWLDVWERVTTSISRWAIGVVVIAMIAGTTQGMTAWLLGSSYAIALGVIAGLLDMIPNIGATIAGFILVPTLWAEEGVTAAIIMLIVVLVYQQVENNILTPKIQGKAVELSGFFIIVAVTLFGALLGVLGALTAVPLAATIQIFIQELTKARREKVAEARAASAPHRIPIPPRRRADHRAVRGPRLTEGHPRTFPLVFRSAVDDLPLWLLLVVFVAAVVGLVLLLVWLIRRLVPAVAEGFDAEVASQMLGVVAALFGLLLAFIIVIAYQNYSDAQSNVTAEADALAAIVRDTGAFSQPERERVRASIGVYVRTVADEEWPLLRKARTALELRRPSTTSSPRCRRWTRRRLRPWLSTTTPCVSSMPASRLAGTVSTMPAADCPGSIGALLFVGSLVIVGYAMLIGSRSFWFHAIGAGAIVVIVAMSLVVLVALDLSVLG